MLQLRCLQQLERLWDRFPISEENAEVAGEGSRTRP